MNSQLFLAVVFFCFLGCAFLPKASAIECYQCDSNIDLECSEEFDQSTAKLKAQSCDHIHEARFCIKTTGMYGGRIGTIRNCSSRDLGDYCSYIDRPGDIRFTRSCMFTCSRDGCNGARQASSNSIFLVLMTTALGFILFLISS